MTDYIKCKKCRGNVNDRPPKCPYCGVIQPAIPFDYLGCLSAIVLLAMVSMCLFGLYSCIHESPEEKQRAAQEEAEKAEDRRRRGFHCLSGWDGSNADVVQQVKRTLKNPASFEHVSTKIAPMDNTGAHRLVMYYRAKNAFGALDGGQVIALVRNTSCDAQLLSSE